MMKGLCLAGVGLSKHPPFIPLDLRIFLAHPREGSVPLTFTFPAPSMPE
ncbi:MAG: hypothetical protein JXB30_04865 [Anaerolineae bacterium]|nr:hypothetical protein [Anaerolineae bacterium]